MVDIKLFEIEKQEDKKMKFINPLLPKPPFRWLFVGFSGSGKSTIIKNVCFNDKFYKKYFDEIYFFTGSLDDVDEMNKLIKKNRMAKKMKVVGPPLNLTAIEQLYKSIEEDNLTKKNKIRTLFIFDDLITSNAFNGRKLNIIDKIFVQGRHANISCILSTQKYKSLNPNLRNINCTALTVFGSNVAELQAIAEEHSNHLTKDELLKILKQAQEKKYNSITINYTNDIQNRFLNNKFTRL